MILLVIAIGVAVVYWSRKPEANSFNRAKEEQIEKIIKTEEFQAKIRGEAEKMYYQKMKEEAEENLLKLQESGFSGETITALKSFLDEHNPSLSMYAEEIVKMPRWIEVVAIAGAETSFCTKGVGASRNNCGAIMASDGSFQSYEDDIEGLRAVARLLQSDRYKEKTIHDMNGVYCIDDNTHNNKCEGWTERVLAFVGKIQDRLS